MVSKYLEEYFKYAQQVKKGTTVAQEQDQWKPDRMSKVRPATFNIEKRSLQAIFEIEKKWGYLQENPFVNVTTLKVEERRLYMTGNELKRLFAVLDSDIVQARERHHRELHRLFRSYVDFMLNTGLRWEEGLQLGRENVDLQKGVIFIGKTKDKDARIIPLTNQARMILEQLGDGLFGELKKNTATQKFISAASRAGLQGFKLHSLRHYAELGIIVTDFRLG